MVNIHKGRRTWTAGGIGEQDPHETEKGHMQSPASGKEAALTMTQTGE